MTVKEEYVKTTITEKGQELIDKSVGDTLLNTFTTVCLFDMKITAEAGFANPMVTCQGLNSFTIGGDRTMKGEEISLEEGDSLVFQLVSPWGRYKVIVNHVEEL